jgi:hypothetical protein
MSKTSEAARMLARRSVEARQRKWGEEGFRERMQAWGKLGGRPRTSERLVPKSVEVPIEEPTDTATDTKPPVPEIVEVAYVQ